MVTSEVIESYTHSMRCEGLTSKNGLHMRAFWWGTTLEDETTRVCDVEVCGVVVLSCSRMPVPQIVDGPHKWYLVLLSETIWT